MKKDDYFVRLAIDYDTYRIFINRAKKYGLKSYSCELEPEEWPRYSDIDEHYIIKGKTKVLLGWNHLSDTSFLKSFLEEVRSNRLRRHPPFAFACVSDNYKEYIENGDTSKLYPIVKLEDVVKAREATLKIEETETNNGL